MSNLSNLINYKGSVKVKLVKNRKVYSQKTFKNNGRWPLFKHLAQALAGNYIEAEAYRPNSLLLFSIPYDKTDNGKIPTVIDGGIGNQSISYYTKDEYRAVGSIVTFMEKPDVPNVTTSQAQVTYKFLIPLANLKLEPAKEKEWGKEGYTLNPINLVCLYSVRKQNEDWNEDPTAYFFVANEDDVTKLGNLLPEGITGNKGDYSLIIEWTLTLNNKKN